MTDIYKKLTELNSKYGNESSEFEEELTEHLKKKFPEQYKLSLEDLKNDGSDDPLRAERDELRARSREIREKLDSARKLGDALPILPLPFPQNVGAIAGCWWTSSRCGSSSRPGIGPRRARAERAARRTAACPTLSSWRC